MKLRTLLMVAVLAAAPPNQASPQVPALPDGARTQWRVQAPEEIVGYLLFDPASVVRRLPPTLRFITIGELARDGVPWARRYLAGAPDRGGWGISFIEIVRTGVFTIDGRAPHWPENGAVALWFARVAPADSGADPGPGLPLLVLDFWVPDSTYAAEMRAKGHYATYGDARLARGADGTWEGSLRVAGLEVAARCTPSGPVSGGAGARGMQALFPPESSRVRNVVRIAFAGHREQECAEATSWTIRGTHPLSRGILAGPSSFEFGYALVGGAYRR